MYVIDINLLRDRPEFGGEVDSGTVGGGTDNTPIIIGGVAAAVFIGLVVLGAAGATYWTSQLQAKKAEVEARLGEVAPKLAELGELKTQVTNMTAETKALTTIFNQVKPWSALLQDITRVTPTGIQVTKITQAAPPAPPPPPPVKEGEAPPPPPPPPMTSELTIEGQASSFDSINDFLLLLNQKSPFVVKDASRLVAAARPGVSSPLQVANCEPSFICFRVMTTVNDVPASELIQALEQNGASGLASRIKFLKERGVVTQ
ncbi:PilN domain-containing protein [Synechococcus sp. PCC 6312]|uniref:PilN domain-containing protein n=1 Tax=Synechococcus sp. (strain ATCC 27167 / PCC 6312) TaxID=195253 RepID=UPI00029F0A3F|nr:PilN domain-containing protein [Synechococcus sp. PCC 6312]AFY60586.1 Tfp pilus assembly protein PilN [Synechococcus sp. PCC 6312]